MSSEISTDASSTATALEAGTFRPWQFFLLAGMLAATASVIMATGQSAPSIVMLSVTVVAASFVGLGVYRSLVPLVSPETVQAPTLVGGRTRAALEREKSLVLRSIKELDFDYAMGKVAQSDFDEMSGRLRSRAIGLMRQLDSSGGYRDLIEKELHARLGSSAPGSSTPLGTGLSTPAGTSPSPLGTSPSPLGTSPSPLGTSPSPLGTSPSTGQAEIRSVPEPACASCGTANDADARFCKNCGTKLTDSQ